MNDDSCRIDGFGPVPLVRPESVGDLSAIVRQAALDRDALYPVGGGTMLHLGQPPSAKGKAVAMQSLARVIDFPARDMTVTVEAGITLKRLRDILEPENLHLPIDVPRADLATLGGAVAANTCGSRRLGYGTLRDYVIGISAINDAGQEFKAGGRVVKNVAGYDMCKLLIGSLGTLGIITGLTLKLRPRPEEAALVSLACEDQVLEAVLAQIHASRTRPTCIELCNRAAAREIFSQANMTAPEGAWVLVVGFDGNTEAVKWQVQQLVRESGPGSGQHTVAGLEAQLGFTAMPLWQALAEWGLWPKADVTFKASVLPSALARCCRALAGLEIPCLLRAHAGNGIIEGHYAAGLTEENAVTLLARWRDSAGAGHVLVPRCPAAWKTKLAVWGTAPTHAWLMREVKNKFDPRRIFNPGRFVDGI